MLTENGKSGEPILIRPMESNEAELRDNLAYLAYREWAQTRNLPEMADRGRYGRFQRADCRMMPEQNRFLFCNGLLASTVTIYLWPVRMAGREVLAGLIGNVATHPDYRGRGYVRMLMDDAKVFMREKGVGVSWLYGALKVYGSSGYEPFEGYGIISGRNFNQLGKEVEIAPLDMGKDLDEVVRIHDDWNRDVTGPVIRFVRDWSSRILAKCVRGWDCFHVVRKKGAVIGYGQILPQNTVGEVGAIDATFAPDVLCALATISENFLQFGFCCAKLESALRKAAKNVEKRTSTYGLWLLINGEKLGLCEPSGNKEMFDFLKKNEFVYYPSDRF